MEGGRWGGGRSQARQSSPSRYFALFPLAVAYMHNAHASYIHNITIINAERRNHFESITNILLLGEGNYCKEGNEGTVFSLQEWDSFNNLQ
jgi:hypothetical protein